MKKNLLTLMFIFSFVFFGILTSRVEASNGNATNQKKVENLNFKANKSVRAIEFNKKYAELKKECKSKFGAICDQVIGIADQASQLAWSVCGNPNFSTEQCYAYQDWALRVFDQAMAMCRLESALEQLPVSSIQKRKDELLESISSEISEKVATTK